MRVDHYTKTILTIIALLLAVIALHPIINPQPVMAQGSGGSVQFSMSGADICFYLIYAQHLKC
jgi:hypothetical protein